MITVRTVQSAEMAGRAQFEAWREQWEEKFFEPVVVDFARATLLSLPPEKIEQLKQSTPEAFASVARRTGLVKEGE